jgi:hypothetical protein
MDLAMAGNPVAQLAHPTIREETRTGGFPRCCRSADSMPSRILGRRLVGGQSSLDCIEIGDSCRYVDPFRLQDPVRDLVSHLVVMHQPSPGTPATGLPIHNQRSSILEAQT